MKKLGLMTAALVLAACESMPPAQVQVQDGVLVGPHGMTLYTFDRDTAGSGTSLCNGPCAANWPPLKAEGQAAGGDYGVITRDDGSQQRTYKGKPLYYWVKDTRPGDKTGDGVNQVWRAARP